jgi:hypothetical protein
MPSFRGHYIFPAELPARRRKTRQQEKAIDEVRSTLKLLICIINSCPRCQSKLNDFFEQQQLLETSESLLKNELRGEEMI